MHRMPISQVLLLRLSRATDVVTIVLVQAVKGLRLGLSTAAVPGRGPEGFGRVTTVLVAEDVLEGLSPLHPVVEALQTPQLLQEVQDRSVRVGGVVRVHRALIVNEGVGRDPGRDQERGNAILD